MTHRYERAGEWSITQFNLALLHHKAGRFDEAMQKIECAIGLEADRAYRVLRGDILDKAGQRDAARIEWQDAIDGQPDLVTMDDFTLGWMENAARKLDNAAMLKRIQEHRRKINVGLPAASQQGELPEHYDSSSSQQNGLAA